MTIIKCLVVSASALAATLHAGPRTSANYSIPAENIGASGARTISASYTSDGNLGDAVGISTVASPAETARQGYVGQLCDIVAVQVAASPTTMNEGTTRQLAATALLDDATTTAFLGTELNWSVAGGPLSGISGSGLATAGIVYQDSAATVHGSYGGVTGTLGLTVINVGTDDFGIYAGDGLPDAWQVQYFGVNNPLAAPTCDADGTGENNQFKYIAGLNPIDPASRFAVTVTRLSGLHTITFSPRLPDRTYTPQFSTTLTAWQTLAGAGILDNAQTRTLTDSDTTSKQKFYRILISVP